MSSNLGLCVSYMFKLWLSIWFKQFTQKWKSWSSFTNLFGFPLIRKIIYECCPLNKNKKCNAVHFTHEMESQIQHFALLNTVFHTCTPNNFTKRERLCREILRENLHSVIVCMWFRTHPLCRRYSESSFTIHSIYLQFHLPLYLW